jgi:hypothetical protein
MALAYDPSITYWSGQNIRPPLGSWFNGQSYWIKVHPELGNSNRSVMVVSMILQFQYIDGPGGSWTTAEKTDFAHKFIWAVQAVWNEKHRLTTSSTVPVAALRDVGITFDLRYYIDGWHTNDDFEIGVTKHPADASWLVSVCSYSSGETTLDSNDLRPETKGASMKQRDAVHEFGHMLGLRDEYAAARSNVNHLSDLDSIMNVGEVVRPRHYAPFAAWMTEKSSTNARLTRSTIEYKVNGTVDMSNAAL